MVLESLNIPLMFQIVNEQDKEEAWEPPKTQTDVLNSKEYKIMEGMMDIACRNSSPVMERESETDQDQEFSFRNKAEREEFYDLVLSSVYLETGRQS